MNLSRIGFLVFALLLAPAAGAAMYKWVDEQGNVHYSQQPPRGGQAEVVAPPPPPASPGKDRKRLDKLLESQDERREARSESETEAAESARAAERRKKNCATARGNLTTLTTGGRKRILGEDGEAYYMTEEERQAKIEQARKHIEEFCD